ncbi:hypothetical protein OJ996_02395 [Luteolibacter sp. GHJ8]|uniref:Uncharacterized protein n=1 Tax=Luteolibacter rhizosphaerae TaxID=2989719 RepID=A0ABT3FYU4_9BACT|nr:hypothetical protein [Luteolibacter rhizosphaerae]MCW1912404.1 hypothetical protein [Luteolibacter rhizosphaerae]
MKTSRTAALAAALLATGVSAPCAFAQSTEPSKPASKVFTAFPQTVQTGTNPTITWEITYPEVAKDVVTIGGSDPGGGGGGGGDNGTGTGGGGSFIETKTKLNVKVRVLGAGVTVANSNGSNMSFVPTEAQLRLNTGSYSRIFYGTNNNVNPSTVVWSRTGTNALPAQSKLRFGGRYYYNSSWGPYFNSDSGTKNVRILVNGERPPTTYPLHTAPTLESFLKPYLDASGKVKIGPMDCIVFMELTHHDSQMSDQGYDLQDMVLLVTFEKP